MKEIKSRKRVIRTQVKQANSPSPDNGRLAPCGHSHCDTEKCRVRYIGATSSMYNHHILHAARGVTHMWIAVIIAGLAVVLTGAIAFSSVNAQTQKMDAYRTQQSTDKILERMDKIENRIDALERDMETMFRAQANSQTTPITTNNVFPSPPQD